MRVFERGWSVGGTVYAVLCALTAITQADKLHFNNWRAEEPEAIETRRAFKEIDEGPSREMSFQRKLIPIKEPRVDRNFAMYAMPLEPDAEMLPAHYTGVKPPGVDHMELKYAESQVSKVVPKIQKKSVSGSGARQASKQQKSESESVDEGYQTSASFEKAQKGDQLKKKQKTQYTEAGGKGKVHENKESNSGSNAERSGGNRDANYKKKGSGHVDRKAAGYRNVYHKDEYKKDHDFYDNDDHGGHTKKHGRYKEKHVAIEGTFERGKGEDSGFAEAEVHKQGATGKSQAAEESKGHDARRGYDGFFKNFQGFGQQAGKSEGKRFGFGQTKSL